MFCSNLFVELSSKEVRVLRVRHFPPRSSFFFVAPPFVISYLIYDSAEKVIFCSQVFDTVLTSTSTLLFPSLCWDYPEIERLKETMIDENICKITTLPPPSASLSLFLSTRPTIISIVPITGTRETVKEAAWRVRPRDVNAEQEKSAPFCHQL